MIRATNAFCLLSTFTFLLPLIVVCPQLSCGCFSIIFAIPKLLSKRQRITHQQSENVSKRKLAWKKFCYHFDSISKFSGICTYVLDKQVYFFLPKPSSESFRLLYFSNILLIFRSRQRVLYKKKTKNVSSL